MADFAEKQLELFSVKEDSGERIFMKNTANNFNVYIYIFFFFLSHLNSLLNQIVFYRFVFASQFLF